jgi:hypothetical protein
MRNRSPIYGWFVSESGYLGLEDIWEPGKETAGPSTTLRSGRDDNFRGTISSYSSDHFWGHFHATELSSRPERSVVEGPAVCFGRQALRRSKASCSAVARTAAMIDSSCSLSRSLVLGMEELIAAETWPFGPKIGTQKQMPS